MSAVLARPCFGTCWDFARDVLRALGRNLPATASGALADPAGWTLIPACVFYQAGDLLVFEAPREGRHCAVALSGGRAAHLGPNRMGRVDAIADLVRAYGHAPTVVRRDGPAVGGANEQMASGQMGK